MFFSKDFVREDSLYALEVHSSGTVSIYSKPIGTDGTGSPLYNLLVHYSDAAIEYFAIWKFLVPIILLPKCRSWILNPG